MAVNTGSVPGFLDWRKLVPDKRHPKSDHEAQEAFKKTPGTDREEWPGEDPIRVMFQDEARFGRISDIRRSWCPKPYRPICQEMVTQEYTYAYAAVSVADGILDSLVLPHGN